MKERSFEKLYNHMQEGRVYRLSDLTKWSTATNRDLDTLVTLGKAQKLAGGLYARSKSTAFGPLPPDDQSLVRSFLKDDRFLINSFNNYTQLGLGLTQLYNNQVVYNYRRHGEFELAGKTYYFKRVPKFPRTVSKEFLLVDLLNNLKSLAEDPREVLNNFNKKKDTFDREKVLRVAAEYGRPGVKKLIKQVYAA